MSKSATRVSASSRKVCASSSSVRIILSAVLRPPRCHLVGWRLPDDDGIGAKPEEAVAGDRAGVAKIEAHEGSRSFVEVHVLDLAQHCSPLAENKLSDWLGPFRRGALLRLAAGQPEHAGTGHGHGVGPEHLQIAPRQKGPVTPYLGEAKANDGALLGVEDECIQPAHGLGRLRAH